MQPLECTQLHKKGVWALLDNNSFYQRSLQGLIEEHPKSYKHLKSLLLDNELYNLLLAIDTKRSEIDIAFDIFVNKDDTPIIIEKKEWYSTEYCCEICNMIGIKESVINKYCETTPAGVSKR